MKIKKIVFPIFGIFPFDFLFLELSSASSLVGRPYRAQWAKRNHRLIKKSSGVQLRGSFSSLDLVGALAPLLAIPL